MCLLAPERARPSPPPETAPVPGGIEVEPISRARYLMGTVCEATAYPPRSAAPREVAGALDAALQEIARLEAVLSDWREDTELSRLNRSPAGRPFPCSSDLYAFLEAAQSVARETGGAFDVTVGPLVRVWDLRGAGRAPDEEELRSTRAGVGFALVRLDAAARSATLVAGGMAIDPGGLGKGFALDAAGRVLRARGIDAALLNFGGQVLALGAPPGGQAWEVAVAHPLRRDEPFLRLRLRDASASTSGNAERSVRSGGRRLGHVLDPRSGRPVETSASATAVAESATLADGYSTALLVMGSESGLRWLEGRADVSAVFLEPGSGGEVVVRASPGFDEKHLARPVRAGSHRGGER